MRVLGRILHSHYYPAFNQRSNTTVIILRTYALRSPNPLFKGASEIPPLKRGARGDRGFKLQCVSPNYDDRNEMNQV
ncbi:hypothetical protein NSTC745_04255 [Nostoc sp. DSM 114161]|jgi:hypothetical protein